MEKTTKRYNGKRITHPNKPNTTVSAYMTPERKRALVELGNRHNIVYGCLVTDAIEAMFGWELDRIESGK